MTPPRNPSAGYGHARIPLDLDRALDEHLVSAGARTHLVAALAARALDVGADIARREPIPDPITVGALARMSIAVPEPPVLDALWRQLPEHERGLLGRVALSHAIATDPARITAARTVVATSLNRFQQLIVLAAARADATADLELDVLDAAETTPRQAREHLAAAEQQRSLAAGLALLQSEVGYLRDQLARLERPDQGAADAVGRWTRIFEDSCATLAPLLTQRERVVKAPDSEHVAALQRLVSRLERTAEAAAGRFRELGGGEAQELQVTSITYLRSLRTLTRTQPAAGRPAAAAGLEPGSRTDPPPPVLDAPGAGGMAR
jgi:hypothetical protein